MRSGGRLQAVHHAVHVVDGLRFLVPRSGYFLRFYVSPKSDVKLSCSLLKSFLPFFSLDSSQERFLSDPSLLPESWRSVPWLTSLLFPVVISGCAPQVDAGVLFLGY